MVSSLSSDRVAKVASISRVIRRLYLDSTTCTGTGGAGRSKHIACESSFRLLLTHRAGMTDKDMICDTSSLFCLLTNSPAITSWCGGVLSADSLEAGKTDNNNRRRRGSRQNCTDSIRRSEAPIVYIHRERGRQHADSVDDADTKSRRLPHVGTCPACPHHLRRGQGPAN